VQPFEIVTSDSETLYAWHILPLGAYIKYESQLLKVPSGFADEVTEALTYKALINDPESLLVITFHGNAGHVAQGWRPDTYRALGAASPQHVHILAFDYRGFGYSTGSPNEVGVINDGIAVVNWALNVAKMPSSRIVLYGQSLGTAVAIAVAEHFAVKQHTDFAGLVLVEPFSDIPTLLPRYFIAGIIPTLSPLRMYPKILNFLLTKIVDTWNTTFRLANLVKSSKSLNLAIIHTRDDFEISWTHSQTLFYIAANATTETGMPIKTIDSVKTRTKLDSDYWIDHWTTEGMGGALKKIKFILFPHGGKFSMDVDLTKTNLGHNRVMAYPVAAKEVAEIFQQAIP
jgi:abhydrolase domain-containing protein 12